MNWQFYASSKCFTKEPTSGESMRTFFSTLVHFSSWSWPWFPVSLEMPTLGLPVWLMLWLSCPNRLWFSSASRCTKALASRNLQLRNSRSSLDLLCHPSISSHLSLRASLLRFRASVEFFWVVYAFLMLSVGNESGIYNLSSLTS